MKNDERNSGKAAEEGVLEVPDKRQINRLISAGARLAKDREAVSRRNKGEWTHLLVPACSQKRAQDVKAQLNYLYAHGTLMAGIGIPHEVSGDTSTKQSETMENLFDDLASLGMRLKDVRHLSRKHVVAAIKLWVRKGQAPATLQTKISAVRRFVTLIGKPEIMPKGAAWSNILRDAGLDPKRFKRAYIAVESKSWLAAGVDPWSKIEEVWTSSPVCGAALLLQLISGARVKESLSDSPMLMDCETFLRLEKGTKGGRKRDVRLAVTEEEFAVARKALERIKIVASTLPRRILCLPGKDFKQMRQHFYYVLRKHGITMKGEGIIPHGLRHGFLQSRYNAVSGLPAPVLREAPPQAYAENAEAVAAAKVQVSGDAGHSRDASYYYTGNPIQMTRMAREAEKAVLMDVEGSSAIAMAFAQAGVVTAWLVGKLAYGVKLENGQAVEIHVLMDRMLSPGAFVELQQAIELAMCRPVSISVSYDRLRRPEVGTEIVLAKDRAVQERS